MITLEWSLPESTGADSFPSVKDAWTALRSIAQRADASTRAELEGAMGMNSASSVEVAVRGGASWRYAREGLRVTITAV